MDYIRGENRGQLSFFPQSLDEYIGEDNVVRFIDAFIENLDLAELGFERARPNQTGRPPYHPGDMFRLYLYGYINKVNTSRLLEREAGRNVELMWLLGKLKPDFKTIADFRRDNAGSIKQACRQFTMLCKQMGLFGGRLVGIDGSKYRAVNSKKRNFTEEKLKGLIKYVDKKVEEYLQTMDEMDSEEIDERKPTKEELTEKIEELRRRKQDYESKKKVLEEVGETQMSLTDPDSRLMKTKDGKNVCYNLQMAVDSKHKLIIAHEVINECNDQQQLLNMARKAKEVLGVEQIEVVADKGYWNGEQVSECDKEGITVYIPEKRTSSKEGIFSKDEFVYRANTDVYECPAKQELQYWYTHKRNGRDVRVYKGVACEGCEIRSKCTTSSTSRLVRRWPGEDALEKMAQRVRGDPDKMKLRGQLVEHPSGTLKRWWGYEQFLTKGLKKVAAESDLMILAYNIRRVINIEGIKKMIEALA
jgi:transposase